MNSFHYPKYSKWLSIGATFLFGTISIVGLVSVVLGHESTLILCIAIPAFLFTFMLAYWGYEFFRRSDEVITFDDSAIHIINKNNSKRTISWNDIYTIHERCVLQRIEVIDSTGNTLLKIDYQLVGFDTLFENILSRVKNRNNSSQKNMFISSWYVRGIFVVCGVLFSGGIIGSFMSGQLDAMWYFVGFVLFCIVGYLLEVQRVIVDKNTITIKNYIRKKVVNYSDIEDVFLKSDRDGKGNLISTVFLSVVNKKPLKIAGMQGGSFVVYETIKSAWKSYQVHK